MIARVLGALLLVAPLMPVAGQQPTAAQRTALIAAREAVWRAYFNGDSLGLVSALPE